jgi:PKHD-type hydroxylase
MSFQASWYFTNLPTDLVNFITEDLENFDSTFNPALTYGGLDLKYRDSKTTWIPSHHWICGFCYHYVLKANRENFKYDINGFDNEKMQYTLYSEGEYYHWHTDGSISNHEENQRKLSVVLQLSDPEDYKGGEMQLIGEDGSLMVLPKVKGSIIVFDSRLKHRVRKIESGTRKSLVGWVCGPRWK